MQSWLPGKKLVVLACKGRRQKVVHFGDVKYRDYTQHGNKQRRKDYLTRSAGIHNGKGRLTLNDKFSPNYWSRRVLWKG